MANFMEWIFWLQSIGLADVLIPFFLVFAVAYGVLLKAEIFTGKGGSRFNAIIALSMAFAVVIPHVMWGTANPTNPFLTTGVVDIVKLINNSLPEIAAVLIGIIMVIILLGAFGWNEFGSPGWLKHVGMALSFLVIIYIFGTNAGWFYGGAYPWWLWWLSDPETQMMLITLLVFGLVTALIIKTEPAEKKTTTTETTE